MRRTNWVVAAGAALAVLASQAVFADNSQQEKMKTCNADAASKDLKGAERKAFMKTCLSHEHEEGAAGKTNSRQEHEHEEGAAKAHEHEEAGVKTNSQQEKMKTCNAEASAKSMKGEEREHFMSTCLKGSKAAGK